ncbi:MAG TPA: hypothetical protein VFY92_11340, partial [Hyphomicrobiaceae bacterium]|nr:hypothetical protein [Hyphomicrobiaceae bacterium]
GSMVREFSAGAQHQQADGGAAAQPDLQSSTANLTQELSLLLAQTLAHGQAGKRTPAAAAAGSDFANLTALVTTATQTQRNMQPSFRDGLSSLSYTRPAPPPPPLAPPPAPALAPTPANSLISAPVIAPPANGLLVSEPHDEEPMPIPSTWRQPQVGDDDRWYRQQLGAAGLGLVAGLIVVVPAVLWLSGLLGGAHSKPARQHSAATMGPAVKVAEVRPVKAAMTTMEPRITVTVPAAQPVEPQPVVRVAPTPAPRPQARSVTMEPPPATVASVAVPAPRPIEPVPSHTDELVALAKRRIDIQDVTGARDMIQQASETATSGTLTFMLAETYDPNMLASWQTRGVAANPEKARALYQKARDLGESRAQQRLDWLMAN